MRKFSIISSAFALCILISCQKAAVVDVRTENSNTQQADLLPQQQDESLSHHTLLDSAIDVASLSAQGEPSPVSQTEELEGETQPNLIVSFTGSGEGLTVSFDTALTIIVNGERRSELIQPNEPLELTVEPGDIIVEAFAPGVNAGSEEFVVAADGVTRGTIELSSEALQQVISAKARISEADADNVINVDDSLNVSLIGEDGAPIEISDKFIIMVHAIRNGSFTEGLGGVTAGRAIFAHSQFTLLDNVTLSANDPESLFAEALEKLNPGDFQIAISAVDRITELPIEVIELFRIGDFNLNGVLEIPGDASGKLIELRSPSMGVSRAVTTGSDGVFSVAGLPQGVYQLSSEVTFEDGSLRSAFGLVELTDQVVLGPNQTVEIVVKPVTLQEKLQGVDDIVQDLRPCVSTADVDDGAIACIR